MRWQLGCACRQVYRQGDKRLAEFKGKSYEDDDFPVQALVHQRTVKGQVELRVKWKVRLQACLNTVQLYRFWSGSRSAGSVGSANLDAAMTRQGMVAHVVGWRGNGDGRQLCHDA